MIPMLKKILLPVLIVSVSLGVAALLAFQEAAPESDRAELPTMLVDVVRVEKSTAVISVSAQGTVTPRTRTRIVSEVSGLIVEVAPAFEAGGFFRKGDVLVRIDKN